MLRTAGAAHAANAYLYLSYNGYGVGEMVHKDDGDTFQVWDRRPGGRSRRTWSALAGTTLLGSGYASGVGTDDEFAYNVREGVKYTMELCLADGATDSTPIICTSANPYERRIASGAARIRAAHPLVLNTARTLLLLRPELRITTPSWSTLWDYRGEHPTTPRSLPNETWRTSYPVSPIEHRRPPTRPLLLEYLSVSQHQAGRREG